MHTEGPRKVHLVTARFHGYLYSPIKKESPQGIHQRLGFHCATDGDSMAPCVITPGKQDYDGVCSTISPATGAVGSHAAGGAAAVGGKEPGQVELSKQNNRPTLTKSTEGTHHRLGI